MCSSWSFLVCILQKNLQSILKSYNDPGLYLFIYIFLAVLGFEFRASCLLGQVLYHLGHALSTIPYLYFHLLIPI
jgi:hypothetical protein